MEGFDDELFLQYVEDEKKNSRLMTGVFQDINWRNLAKKMSLSLGEPEKLLYTYKQLEERLKDWETRLSNHEVNGPNLYRCIRIFMDGVQQQPEQQHVVEGGGPAEPIPQEQPPPLEENQSANDEPVSRRQPSSSTAGEPVRSFNPRTAVAVYNFVDILHERTFRTANEFYTGNLPPLIPVVAPPSTHSRRQEHSRRGRQPSSSTLPRQDGASTSGEPPEPGCCGDIRLW
ncbi:hypothetical protein LXL04_023687 [Taraxacum kok-saghyz]